MPSIVPIQFPVIPLQTASEYAASRNRIVKHNTPPADTHPIPSLFRAHGPCPQLESPCASSSSESAASQPPLIHEQINNVLDMSFLPTITYLTNLQGQVVSVEDMSWNLFVDKNCHPWLNHHHAHLDSCRYPSIVGQSIFKYIQDPKLRQFHRHLMNIVSTGQCPRLKYAWYNDTSTIERKMSMTISRLISGDQIQILWTSTLVSEHHKEQYAPYLDLPPHSVHPSNTCCTFCKRIQLSLSDVTLKPELVESFVTQQSDTQAGSPDFELNGVVPVLGAVGKRGWHAKLPFVNACPYVWLTPVQLNLATLATPIQFIRFGICDVCWLEIKRYFAIPDSND